MARCGLSEPAPLLKRRRAIGLLGGSFNPAHGGHRRMSLMALHRLRLDEVWWLVSPQNPLKPVRGMAPMAARLQSARRVARHPRIRPTAIEAEMGTQRTVDTLQALQAAFPQLRFVWLMGSDNLMQFHRWIEWRRIAHMVPIVVMARPLYAGKSQFSPAMGWLRFFRHPTTADWRSWKLPALAIVDYGLDRRSATAIRAARADWADGTEIDGTNIGAGDAPRARTVPGAGDRP